MVSYCSNMQLLQQGAEAKIYETNFFGRPTIVKERFSKKYRLPEIDEKLTRKRVSQEIRALQRCRKAGIYTPAIYFVDVNRNVIFLQKIDGITIREHITNIHGQSTNASHSSLTHLVEIIGGILAKLHDADIIHGDLTTSNMMIKTSADDSDNVKDSDICLIDFGLSSYSAVVEAKGVDLYVLERAFLSTHPGTEELFEKLLHAYRCSSKHSKLVLDKLDEVRLRGRKRSMVG